MPKAFEAHVKLQGFTQQFRVYGTDDRFSGGTGSASIGSRSGGWLWWANVNRLDSTGQPIAFANRLVSSGVVANTGTPVTGAVADKNPKNQDWLILGATNRIHTVQDHAKLKLAYDFSPVLRVSYTFGHWTNRADREVSSYLRDAAGNTVYDTPNHKVNIDGRDYTLAGSDFAPNHARLEHVAHALSVKSNTRGELDWETTASVYDYAKDEARSPLSTIFLPAAAQGGAGRITDLKGTGWNTLALKGTWRPQGVQGEHIVEAGLQREAYKLRTLVSNTTDWRGGEAGSRFSAFNGNTELLSGWAQDAWRFSPQWKAVIGGRFEDWRAYNGSIADATTTAFTPRSESHISPKAALSYSLGDEWTFKASVGRAVRLPTVAELYQGSISAGTVLNNNPNLKPEKSWTGEVTAEHAIGSAQWRATLFRERTQDALYSQTNVSVTPNVTNIQNVDAMRTTGLELAAQASDLGLKGLDLAASLTYADSIITKKDKFPASVGQWQPRVPKWRANLLATWRPDEAWSFTGGVRYSGRQYGTLNNSDPNGSTYTGVSSFLVADVRVQSRIGKRWKLSAGIDNIGNRTTWAFHPYTQRTYSAELRYDL